MAGAPRLASHPAKPASRPHGNKAVVPNVLLRYARLCAGVLLCGLVWGCATPMTEALRQHDAGLPLRAELATVPFHPQQDHQCGPAALATIMQTAGVQVSPEALIGEVYLPDRLGSLQVELQASSRRHGLLAYRLEASLEALLAEVNGGTPVLVLLNLGLDFYPVWHYAVVIGFDRPREELLLRSGREPRQVMPFRTFERTWARADHWAMLALPPGKLPARASEVNYLKAAVDLEQSGPADAARTAYQTALTSWPNSLVAAMGLGNSAYRLNDLAGAELAFRQAAQHHPDSWQALNNLAMVVSELGRNEEALGIARTAQALWLKQRVDAGTPSPVESTLGSIQQRINGP